MAVPDWIWFVFIFAFGCCIGSFLNVVIYRLPRDKSLVTPGSACPACGRHIRFYDNIPLISWLVLGRKCRYCKAPVSPRYFVIEMLTGVVFLSLFILYFRTDLRRDLQPFSERGWLVYLLHIAMLGAFIAASAIDLEHWIIPLSICWFVTAVGLIGSAAGAYVIDPELNRAYSLLPLATPKTGALALGATVGLAVSLMLLATGLLKRSYESDVGDVGPSKPEDKAVKDNVSAEQEKSHEEQFNHRLEACREIIFLLPIILCAYGALRLSSSVEPVNSFWGSFSQRPVVAGLLGSLWGYFAGCGIVWAIRIFGTFAFGKEAMGLGDVHLMGAAGAVIGAFPVVIAFFIAPFSGLAWAGVQMFFKKIRQIPYGPFLSLGVFVVMILHELILNRIGFIFYR
ncbi:MAG: prepilin peptidase [Phycisphaerales bacterium]|nr:MAG: prepilin peptidase [Phycisphaerales bacterium]